MNEYSEFENRLGYEFKDKSLLKTAFTHTTYVFENNKGHYDSNQRLEYIGDAVCESSFARVARRLGIGQYLLLGKGEEQSGGRDKDSTLADAFESLVAAVYFDGGFDEAKKVILNNLSDIIDEAIEGKIFNDYKSRLLEIAQTKNHQHSIVFQVINESGPAHQREFEVAVYADGQFLAKAVGFSKKNAEQKCAAEAIKVYKEVFPDA